MKTCFPGARIERRVHRGSQLMARTTKTALIVARPGPLRNSLFALMASMPEIDLTAECKDLSALMSLGGQIKPDLILMEADFAEGQLALIIDFIKREWPSSRSMILVDEVGQQQEAREAGADVVLFKGYRAAGLVWNMKDLLAQGQATDKENRPMNAAFTYR